MYKMMTGDAHDEHFTGFLCSGGYQVTATRGEGGAYPANPILRAFACVARASGGHAYLKHDESTE